MIQWLTCGIQWQYRFSLNPACRLFIRLPKNLWNHLRSKYASFEAKSLNIKGIFWAKNTLLRLLPISMLGCLRCFMISAGNLTSDSLTRTFWKSLQIWQAGFNEYWTPAWLLYGENTMYFKKYPNFLKMYSAVLSTRKWTFMPNGANKVSSELIWALDNHTLLPSCNLQQARNATGRARVFFTSNGELRFETPLSI